MPELTKPREEFGKRSSINASQGWELPEEGLES